MAWVAFTFIADDVLTSTEMTNLFNNFQAFADKASGAPVLKNSYVTRKIFKSMYSTLSGTNLPANQITYIGGQLFGGENATSAHRIFNINRYSGNGSPVLFSLAIRRFSASFAYGYTACDNKSSVSDFKINSKITIISSG